jgi:hypothetical protein
MSEQGEQKASQAASACRLGSLGAVGTLLGVALSGPLAVAIVAGTHPQPRWHSAELFARNYHPIQLVPYAGGFLLVGGLVLLIAALGDLAGAEHKTLAACALVFAGVFAGFVFLNYMMQTTFIPHLARTFIPAHGPLIEAFSMSNPTSLAWGIEMWGYGFLGVATWLVAPVLRQGRLERLASLTLAANGPMSIAGAVATSLAPGWVLTGAGIAAFVLWNLVVVVFAALTLAALRRRLRSEATREDGLKTTGANVAFTVRRA